jgi:serine/threonine kinase 32
MEEQFTSYDFKKMNRRSYYPQNQLVSQITATTSSGLDAAGSSRPVTPAISVLGGGDAVSIAAVPNGYPETERYGQGVPLTHHMVSDEKQQ